GRHAGVHDGGVGQEPQQQAGAGDGEEFEGNDVDDLALDALHGRLDAAVPGRPDVVSRSGRGRPSLATEAMNPDSRPCVPGLPARGHVTREQRRGTYNAPDMPSVVFADLVGSTGIFERLGDETAGRFVTQLTTAL